MTVMCGRFFISILQVRKMRLQEGQEVAISRMACSKEFRLAQREAWSLPLASEGESLSPWKGKPGKCLCLLGGLQSHRVI